MSHTPPAPRQLYELREWLMDRIDGSEEMRGEDSLISGFIAEIDALEAQIVGLTRPKTITEWVAAQAQTEPRGCPTPGACSAVADQTRLRRMAEHERDGMLEKLIVHQTTIANLHDVIDGMRNALAPSATGATEITFAPRGKYVVTAANSLPVEEGTITDAARYRHVRGHPEMLLHLSNKDFDAAIDKARGSRMKIQQCEHGKGLTDYCEPCGRIHGS